MPRTYRLKRRAARQEETRLRIVDAAVALHGEVGPARTTITAIAERAGVQRHTLYRYFADESEIFRACAARFLSLHPPPDPRAWLAISDPVERARTGIDATYAYFRDNAALMANVLRDADVMPVGGGFLRFRAELTEVLSQRWEPVGGHPQLRAVIGLTVSFQTWQVLTRDYKLDDQQAAEVMLRLVLCTAERLGADSLHRGSR